MMNIQTRYNAFSSAYTAPKPQQFGLTQNQINQLKVNSQITHQNMMQSWRVTAMPSQQNQFRYELRLLPNGAAPINVFATDLLDNKYQIPDPTVYRK